ncbi:MAG: serine/threonine protein kinase [Planctomycetes bacterium]|nr:serine/threonine protein kinase [Planctomycetota bacterium]
MTKPLSTDPGRAGDIESLLAACLEEALDGRRPDPDALTRGDPVLAKRLAVALEAALKLIPPPAAIDPPRRVGPYLIEGEVGHGGMGAVLLGRHETLGRVVALKILPRPFAFIDESRARFTREAQALARVRHPGVVPVYEVGEGDGVPYVALEYVEGGSLEDLLAEMRASDLVAAREIGAGRLAGPGPYETRVARFLAGAADALHAIHQAGLVHRDLKPANLLLNANGRAVIADFGLVRHADLTSFTSTGAIVGTRHFLAPELTQPGGEATVASDVFALGVTLYQMLTLRAPFGGETEERLFRSIREEEPPRPRAINRFVSGALEAICLKALEKSPSRRYVSAAELAADLEAAADRRSVSASSRSPVRRVARRVWFRRRTLGVAIAVGLVLVTTPIAAWLGWREHARRRDAEWVSTFQRAEGRFLAVDPRFDSNLRNRYLRESLASFERCAALVPSQTDACLRLAEVENALGDKANAAKHLATARDRGARGFLVDELSAKIEGHAPTPPEKLHEVVDKRVYETWATIDRIALARRLYEVGFPWAAFKVVMNPDVLREERFAVEAQIALYLGHARHDHTAPILADRATEMQWSMEWCERYLRKYPDSPAVEMAEAIAILDAFNFEKNGELRGLEPVQTYAANILKRYRESENTPYFIGAWLSMLWLQRRLDEAAAELDRLPPGVLSRTDQGGGMATVKIAIALGRYALAFELVSAPALRTYFGGTSGPLVKVVKVFKFDQGYVPDRMPSPASLRAFVESMKGRATDDDWNAAMAELPE